MIFSQLGLLLKQLNLTNDYIIDSFPINVCQNIRIGRSKILKGAQYRGYNASKKTYFYGLKIQLLTTACGLPVEYYFTPGSNADINAFQGLSLEKIEGSTIYADAGYTSYQIEEELAKRGINFLVERKKNSKRPHTDELQIEIKTKRKRIETTISQIVKEIPRRIQDVTQAGFTIKILLFIFAYTLNSDNIY